MSEQPENIIYSKKSGAYAWPQFKLLGILLAAYLIFNIYQYGINFYGLEFIVIIIGILVNFITTGFQIDFKRKRYREYAAIGKFFIGKWVALPELEYVTVFRENTVETGGNIAVRVHDKHMVFRVRLIGKKEERFEAGGFDKKERAIEAGKQCANKLSIKFLDYTDKDPKWVTLDPE